MESPTGSPRVAWLLGGAAAFVLFALPIITWYAVIGAAPGIPPKEAARHLAAREPGVVVVDVTPRRETGVRLRGVPRWPWEVIRSMRSSGEVPSGFRDRKLLLLCESGQISARAAAKLRSLGVTNAFSVRDGLAGVVTSETRGLPCLTIPSSEFSTEALSFYRPAPSFEQWSQVLSGFAVKPIYMILSLILILWLRRNRSSDLTALRWSLVGFLAGETLCAANYLACAGRSHLLEYGHMVGMVVGFGFGALALADGIDRHIIHFSSGRQHCALTGLCRGCVHHTEEVSCGLRRLFLLILPAAMMLALLPFCSRPEASYYNTTIFGTPYSYTHPAIYQVFETRFCPVYAILLFGASLFTLLKSRNGIEQRSKALFAAGVGFLGFGFFRFALYRTFADDLVWMSVWEEVTELLGIGLVAAVLWIFRRSLLPGASTV